MKRLFSSDPVGKKVTIFHCEEPGQYVLETKQDVTEIVEMNKREYNAHSDYRRFGGESFRKVANLPLHMLFDPETGRMKEDDELKKMLNDPTLSAFRTMPGRV